MATLKKLLTGKMLLIIVTLLFSVLSSQAIPTFKLYLTNEVQVSPTQYEFDIYLQRTGIDPLELSLFQFGLSFDTAIMNGGVLSIARIAGTSDLPAHYTSGSIVVGLANLSVNGVISRHINSAAGGLPPGGPGTGFIVPDTGTGCSTPGARINRFRLTNTAPFKANSTCKHIWSIAAGSQKTNTIVSAYIGTTNTNISNGVQATSFLSYNTTGTCIQNIILNPAASCAVVAGATTTDVSCFGRNDGSATVTLNGSGTTSTGTYTLDGGPSTPYNSNPFTVSGLTAGAHDIFVTTTTPCTALANFTITGPAQPPAPTVACYETATWNSAACLWDVTGTQPPAPTGLACWETATFNNTTCVWDVTGTQPPMPTLACYETATFNNTTCVWDVTGTQPPAPTGLACYETATFNNTTCVWDVTGTQPPMPTLACYETATFNTTTCVWDVTGTQPPAPTGLACYETATFNNTTCVWDVTGTQPPMPTLACYETATFNNSTCVWDVTGTQPPAPTGLACYETATFNNSTCVWDVAGTQPPMPTLACFETATFNNSTCVWDVTGTQPPMPSVACYETATFNNTTCVWDITGTQPPAPTTACYETATFNNTTCVWDVTGTQPPMPSVACYETATFNNTTCVWDITGTQPPAPTGLACYETATFNNSTCVWDVTGTQPPAPTTACYETATFNSTTCVWDITGTQPPAPTGLACYETATFNNTTCVWDVTGTQPPAPTTACYETATFNNTTCVWDITGTQPPMPTIACYETATFNNTTCVWDVTGTQPPMPTIACYETATFNSTTCVWDVTGTQPPMPTLACYETATFNTTTCVWDVTGTQPPMPTLACYETATFNTTTCAWDVTGTQPPAPTGLACYQTATFNNATCVWDVTGSPLEVTATPSGTIACFGGMVSVTVTATGGNPPYSGTGSFNQAAGTVVYTVSDDNGCTSTASVTLTEPIKVEGTVATTPATCGFNDGTATVTPTGGTGGYTYLWSNLQTGITATGLAFGAHSVTITDNSNCSGVVNFNISGAGGNPDPAGAISGPPGACVNQTGIVFSIAPVANATAYVWTLPAGATGSSTTNSITVNFGPAYAGGFICVTPTNSCGQGAQSCQNIPVITVKPAQPGFIVGGSNPCGPNVFTYSIPPSANALLYIWSVTGSGVAILSGQGSNIVQVSIPASFGQGTISVKAQNCIGTTSTRTLALTGIPSHSNALIGPGYVCAGTLGVHYYIGRVNGAGSSYVWSTTGNMTVASSNLDSVVVDFGAGFTTGVLSITTSSSCGSFTRNYTIRSTPFQPGSIAGPSSNLCGQTGVTYSIASIATATSYNWTVPAGVNITLNTGTSITVDFTPAFTGTGNICVSAINGCGSSIARCYSVTARPAVPAALDGTATPCKTSSVVYSTSAVAGATGYIWAVTGGATITPAGTSATINFNTATSTTAIITMNAVNACGASSPRKKTLTVNLGCRMADLTASGNESLAIYPNPSTGLVKVNFSSKLSASYLLRVTDLLGNIVVQEVIHASEGMNMQELDLRKAAKGMYLLSLETEGLQSQTLRLIVE